MLTRVAVFEGALEPGSEEAFFADGATRLSIACVALAAVCLVAIAIDVGRHPQPMGIMNVLWPVTALFGSVWVAWQYVRSGRLARDRVARAAMDRDGPVAAFFGWHWLFGPTMFAAWVVDFLFACAFGLYGFMASASFYVFQHVPGVALRTDTPDFWFSMQLAMLCGFATAYPMNWLLIRTGVKKAM